MTNNRCAKGMEERELKAHLQSSGGGENSLKSYLQSPVSSPSSRHQSGSSESLLIQPECALQTFPPHWQ